MFKQKEGGLGWYPTTTEGWIATVGFAWAFIATTGIFIFWMYTGPAQPLYGILEYTLVIILLIVALIYICHKSAEEERETL